jgi:hypothetical protein
MTPHTVTMIVETINVVVDDYSINVLCLEQDEYSSDDFLRYLDSYLEDFMLSNGALYSGGYPRMCLPGYVSFNTYEAVGKILFGLTVDDPEYSSMDTKEKVYEVLWDCL